MNREELMAAMRASADVKPVQVTVKGWGMLYVRPPTVEEVDAGTEIEDPKDGKSRDLARGACRMICDEQGERLFDPANEEHVGLLAKQPYWMLQKLMAAVRDVGVDDSGN